MSQTDVQIPHLPPAPDIPGPNSPEDFIPAHTNTFIPPHPPEGVSEMLPLDLPSSQAKTTDQVQQEMARASGPADPPTLEEPPPGVVYLPAGFVRDGELITMAIVRELNGFDEERLSRLLASDNPAIYVTEMLALAVEDLGGQKPSKDELRNLLIGDRDALWLGIRIASYGPEVEYSLVCNECDEKSVVTINLNEDIPVRKLDDPLKQDYEVELRHGVAKVKLLDGIAQEKYSTNLGKRTQAEINTIMLANSVLSINGLPTKGKEDAVRALSSQDRGTIMDFIIETQPGPQLGTEIEAHCHKCGALYPIVLSPGSLFRF
jgi:hypothetical protein